MFFAPPVHSQQRMAIFLSIIWPKKCDQWYPIGSCGCMMNCKVKMCTGKFSSKLCKTCKISAESEMTNVEGNILWRNTESCCFCALKQWRLFKLCYSCGHITNERLQSSATVWLISTYSFVLCSRCSTPTVLKGLNMLLIVWLLSLSCICAKHHPRCLLFYCLASHLIWCS